jgi:hypothetical protein
VHHEVRNEVEVAGIDANTVHSKHTANLREQRRARSLNAQGLEHRAHIVGCDASGVNQVLQSDARACVGQSWSYISAALRRCVHMVADDTVGGPKGTAGTLLSSKQQIPQGLNY